MTGNGPGLPAYFPVARHQNFAGDGCRSLRRLALPVSAVTIRRTKISLFVSQHVLFPGSNGYDIWKLVCKLKMLAGAHKVLVNAATLDQILVATSFHDRPVIHDHDQVGMKNRR